MKILLITVVALAVAACAGPQPSSGQGGSANTTAAPANQPTALADCVTAVGAERAQCRAQ